MVVNRDSFFLSHRLPLARGARDAGMEVVVAAGDSGSARAIEDEGFEFVSLPVARGILNPLSEARTVTFLLRLYRRLQPALIHHSTVQPVIYGSIAARFGSDAAVVNTGSGLGYAFTSAHQTAKALRPLLRWLWRVALSHPQSRTIFQNPDDRADFIRMGLVHEGATVLIRGSGVDCGAFPPAPEPGGVPVVVLPGRMLWDKGVQEFVEAARILRSAGRIGRFVLVGAPDNGNREAIPVAQLDEWTREGTVEWWGHQSDMAAVLAGATIVVLPSYGEGLPKALLEAASVGRAVVATDVGQTCKLVDETVGHRVKADAASVAAAVVRLLREPGRASKMGQRGRERVMRHHSTEAYLEYLEGVYESVGWGRSGSAQKRFSEQR